MTDSGFSSAASERSTSSIIRPVLINSFSGCLKSDQCNTSFCNSNDEDDLPKPFMHFPSNAGRPVIPNRLIYGKNHGGYSPGLSPFSTHEMSPMSSLTYDFRDLNTSQPNYSGTPRKRLSLSSLSSLDSPFPSNVSTTGQVSNALMSLQSPGMECPNDNDTTLDRQQLGDLRFNVLNRNYKKLRTANRKTVRTRVLARVNAGCQSFRPIAQEDSHKLTASDDRASPPSTGTKNASEEMKRTIITMEKSNTSSISRFMSTPSAKPRSRLLGLKETPEVFYADKENMASPSFADGSFQKFSRKRSFHNPGKPIVMSSPKVFFAHSEASAFRSFSPNDSTSSVVVPHVKNRGVLCDRDVNIPTDTKLDSSSKSNKVGGVKRLLEESTVSSNNATARKRKCSKSLGAKSAFLKERKTKSADAIVTGIPRPFGNCLSPISQLCRPISAPTLTGKLDDDENYVLFHSSLCSHDSDDEMLETSKKEDNKNTSKMFELDDDLEMMCENIISENKRFGNGPLFSNDSCLDDTEIKCPKASTIQDLMSGSLIMSVESNVEGSFLGMQSSIKPISNDGNSSLIVPVGKRELFRSPSAPPVVPSRRALMKLKRSSVRPLPGRNSGENTPVSIKRPRSSSNLEGEAAAASPSLNRSRSYNELDIMRAVDQGCEDPTLIGDFTRPCSLPTVRGRQQDLKYISADTLDGVLKKKYDLGLVEIVDCRYSYEYEGGHVVDAINIWTEKQLTDRYFNGPKPMWIQGKQSSTNNGKPKPHVLIFHCEFSSERGPKLARSLRNHDRGVNVYPHLHYPEIYVLKDGYKEFFRVVKNQCNPCSYVPMSDQAYASELRKFRIKSKTWAGEKSKHGLCSRLKH